MENKKSYSIKEASEYLDKVIHRESENLRTNLNEERKDFISNEELQYV